MALITENRFVGTTLARVAAVVMALVTVTTVLLAQPGSRYRFYAILLSAVLTWLCLVHSSRTLFRLWMQFAEGMHKVVITTLFGLCYLVIVPVFRLVLWYRDPLRLRTPRQQTSWNARKAVVDAGSLERMG